MIKYFRNPGFGTVFTSRNFGISIPSDWASRWAYLGRQPVWTRHVMLEMWNYSRAWNIATHFFSAQSHWWISLSAIPVWGPATVSSGHPLTCPWGLLLWSSPKSHKIWVVLLSNDTLPTYTGCGVMFATWQGNLVPIDRDEVALSSSPLTHVQRAHYLTFVPGKLPIFSFIMKNFSFLTLFCTIQFINWHINVAFWMK